MATLAIVNKMIPDVYDGRYEIETFIEECKRYFQLCGLDQDNQNMMIKCLISRDILPIYEAVDVKFINFEDRLREAFKKPSTLIGDFLNLYNYEKDNDAAPVFFEKIEKMVDKVLKHKWDKNELVAYFLIHCVKDKEIQKEIKMRDALKVEEIKDVIRKVDAINIEVSSIAVMQRKETFANVIKKRQGFADIQDRQRNFSNVQERRNFEPRFNSIPHTQRFDSGRNTNQQYYQRDNRASGSRVVTCWNCQELGHSSRECPKKKCYGCGKEGHMIRECKNNKINSELRCNACKESGHHRGECPSISCSGCGKRGHLRFQCWGTADTRSSGINQSRNYEDNRRYQDRHADRRVAAMEDRGNEAEDSQSTRSDEHPNGRAPSLGEMIGAMH